MRDDVVRVGEMAAGKIVRLRVVAAGAVVRTTLHEHRKPIARPIDDGFGLKSC